MDRLKARGQPQAEFIELLAHFRLDERERKEEKQKQQQKQNMKPILPPPGLLKQIEKGQREKEQKAKEQKG